MILYDFLLASPFQKLVNLFLFRTVLKCFDVLKSCAKMWFATWDIPLIFFHNDFSKSCSALNGEGALNSDNSICYQRCGFKNCKCEHVCIVKVS